MAESVPGRAADLRDAVLLAARDLDRLSAELDTARARVTASSPQLELYGAAALAHGYYTHLERVFERIARDLNSAPHAGPDWHRRLLDAMTLERPGVRPAVIAPSLAVELDELLRFRHLFRNLYVLDLDGERVVALVARIARVHPAVRQSLDQFKGFLEQMAGMGA
jgi:hypothetical protein